VVNAELRSALFLGWKNMFISSVRNYFLHLRGSGVNVLNKYIAYPITLLA
jgi:hypothetical protein